MELLVHEAGRVLHLRNEQISYLIELEAYGLVSHLYYGKRLNDYHGIARYPRLHRDFEVELAEDLSDARDYSIGTLLQEYSGFNRGDFRQPAIILQHEDGSTVTDFRYQRYEVTKGLAPLDGLPNAHVENEQDALTLKIYLRDDLKELTLCLHYTIFVHSPIVWRFATLVNEGAQTSIIQKMSSMQLDLPPQLAELIQLNGTWGRERMLEREPIHHGIKLFDSKRGTSSHHQTPFMALVAKDTTEQQGEALGVNLVYSGSHEMSVEMDPYHQLRLHAGIQSQGFSWRLAPGEQFTTPAVALCYSDAGLNGMSQAYHAFLQEHIIPSRWRSAERPVLLNNWEGTYFDFNEAKLTALIDEAAKLGIELFVLDDGWFGKRDSDTTSLGDWFVHQAKLPNGLEKIAAHCRQKGMQFGLWFEPEMVSEQSELFKAHPDWAIQAPGRSKTFGRHQYVLDMSRLEVVDNIFEQICQILDRVPLDYIKWDMNRHLTEIYSLALPANQQGEVAHRFVLGVYDLMQRVTSRYPQILFESCSGGGGRFDWGILAYMPQTWTSDNTDAVARLKIQYGTSLYASPNTMGAHVSAVPNHQTKRMTSLAMRAAVAYMGDLGYELDVTQLDDAEKAEIAQQISLYKQHRRIFQQGIYTRLMSPFEHNLTAWMVHTADKQHAIVSVYQVLTEASLPLQVIKVPNLDPQQLYSVSAGQQTFEATGAELAQIGFYLFPQLEGDYASRLYFIQAI